MHVSQARRSLLCLQPRAVWAVTVECLLYLLLALLLLGACAPAWAQSSPVIIMPSAGNGTAGYSGDGGPATAAQLSSPGAVAMDTAGNYYIADQANHVIRKVTTAGIISTVAGSGSVSYSGDGGPALSAGIANPRAITVDVYGNIFFVDGNLIREVVASNGSIYKVTTPSGPVVDSGCIQGLCAVLALTGAVGIASDGIELFVSDSAANGVYKVGPAVGTASLFVGTGAAGYSGDGGSIRNATLNGPQGVAAANGYLYIADTGNHVIRLVDYNNPNMSGVSIATFAGNGTSGYSGDNGPRLKAQFISPRAIAVDGSLNVYIADSAAAVIREVNNASQNVITLAGTGTQGYSGDWGLATAADLNSPSSIASDYYGNVYLADPSNQVIRRIGTVTVAATPVFSPSPGSYATTQSVSITDATAGATIFYTVDGTTPTPASSVYVAPITVATTTTIRAIALAPGTTQSSLAAGTYNIYGTTGGGIITTVAGNAGQWAFGGDGGPATGPNAMLNYPENVAADDFGNFYIADSQNYVVRKVAVDGTLSTVAGTNVSGYSGDGGPATKAMMGEVGQVAVDQFGNLYVADFTNKVVRKITAAGVISTVAGDGTQGFSGDGGPATSAQLQFPWGVAVDRTGNLYISDINAERIRKVTPDGIIQTIAGNGTRGFSGDGGPATSASFQDPYGLSVDPAGNLYIADLANNRIRKVALDGTISTVAGTGNIGYSGDGGPALSANLSGPAGVAADTAGNIFIMDTSNQAVRKVNAAGVISTVAGNGTRGFSGDGGPATSAQLRDPNGLAVDMLGNVYIADTVNSVIREVGRTGPSVPAAPVFDVPSGSFNSLLTVTISDATPGATIYYTLDGSVPTAASTVYAGTLTITSTVTLQAVAIANGQSSLVASATYTFVVQVPPNIYWGPPGTIVAGTALSSAQLNATSDQAGSFTYNPPAGTVITLGQHLLCAAFTPVDLVKYAPVEVCSSIWGVTAGGPTISTVAGTAVQGYSGDGGPATSAKLSDAFAVATDKNGNLYIADTDNCAIRKVAADGTITTIAGNGTRGYSGDGGPATSAQIGWPWALTLDASGNLYFADADANVIREVSRTGIITTVVGTGKAGYSGDGGPATSALVYLPYGLTFDSAGNLFFTDSHNNVIRKVTPGGIISTVAGTGAVGLSGDEGPALSAQLSMPWGLTIDASDTLYFADFNNSKVRKITKDGIIHAVGGYATFFMPSGIAVDGNGNVFIAENQLHVVRQIAPDGTIAPWAGSFVRGYSGDGGAANLAQVNSPFGVAVDVTGNLYVADSLNFVIRKVGAAGMSAAAAPTFSPAAGTYTSPQTVSIVSSAGQSATIYYTTDGSTPTTASTIYTVPITVSATQTIQAIAVVAGFTQSPVASATYTISAAQQTVSFDFSAPNGLLYGKTYPLAASASSGLPVTIWVVSGSAVLDAGNMLRPTGVGQVTVAAQQMGNANFAPSNIVYATVTINPATLTVTADSQIIRAGTALPALTYTISGYVNGDTSAVVQGAPVLTTTAPANPPAGSYPISVAQGTLSATNYSFTLVNGSLTVSPLPDFTLAANPSTLVIRRGQTGTTIITLTPSNGYVGTIVLSCGTLPVDVSCSFSPASLVADGSNKAVQSTLTVGTVSTAQLRQPGPGGRSASPILAGFWIPGALAVLPLVLMRRRLMRNLAASRRLAIALALCALFGFSASCASDTSRVAKPGTSSIAVSATGSAGSTSHQLNLTITIR